MSGIWLASSRDRKRVAAGTRAKAAEMLRGAVEAERIEGLLGQVELEPGHWKGRRQTRTDRSHVVGVGKP